METRALFILLVIALLWLAPKPNTTEAQASHDTTPAAKATPDALRIVIIPYVKPDPAK